MDPSLTRLALQVPVDGTPRKPVHDHSTQELRVVLLGLFSLLGHVPGASNIDLDGAGFPPQLTS